MTFVYFILILIGLVIVHEFGHFIVAKLFKIRVDEFGVFFPPRLFAIKKGETEYSFNSIPVGGFVKIFGENYDEGKSDPRSFVSKPRYVQAAVIAAGIIFNLLFAWLVLSAGYMAGLPTSADSKTFGNVTNAHVEVVGVLAGSPAEKAGLQSGDKIEEVQTATAQLDLRPLNYDKQASNVTNFISSHQDESVVITVLRDGEEKTFLAKATEGYIAGRKAIGVQLSDIGVLRLSPPLALAQGAVLGWEITKSTATGLASFVAQIFKGTADYSQVSGPIGITIFGAATLHQGWQAAIVLVALISINLAVINIVPIPGLDGGRLLIIAIEAIIRRPVSPGVVMKATLTGFALLILLMLVVSYHDIARLIG